MILIVKYNTADGKFFMFIMDTETGTFSAFKPNIEEVLKDAYKSYKYNKKLRDTYNPASIANGLMAYFTGKPIPDSIKNTYPDETVLINDLSRFELIDKKDTTLGEYINNIYNNSPELFI